MREFVVARNPEEESTLPYLVHLPLGDGGVVLKTRDTWPRTAKVYCHPAAGWPEQPEIVERVPVRSCVRRGAAIDLVLQRGRENRSQFVFARARGREVIFWQSARTNRAARPGVSLPTARSAGRHLEILVDRNERYPWTFAHQQATTERRPLRVGDYAVADAEGTIVAAIERKNLQDLVASLTAGRLRFLLADLAALPHAAVVVEDRYSRIFHHAHVRPSVIAEGLAECAVRVPSVPIHFAESRALAQEWTYRFLGAALAHRHERAGADAFAQRLPEAPPVHAEPTTAEVRAWALARGLPVADRGQLRRQVWEAYRAAHPLG